MPTETQQFTTAEIIARNVQNWQAARLEKRIQNHQNKRRSAINGRGFQSGFNPVFSSALQGR